MARYFLKRILIMIPTILGIVLAVFILMSLMNGTNTAEFTTHGNGDALDSVFETLNLHDTGAGRYIRYIYQLFFRLDFGSEEVKNSYVFIRLRFTLLLTVLGIAFSMLIGIPAGIFAAVHRNKIQDQTVSILTLLLSSVPSYCLTIILVVIFAVWLHLLPSFGYKTVKSFVLPTLVLSAGGIALMTRMTRAAVLEVLNKQYVTVLRAKGLDEKKVVFKHILKNVMVTIISTLNNLVAQILCGTLIVENFFNFPGLGQLVITAVSKRDQHMVLVCVILISIILMSVNILSDFLCALINPQIRARYRTKSHEHGGRSNA